MKRQFVSRKHPNKPTVARSCEKVWMEHLEFYVSELFRSEDSQAFSRASSPNLISTPLKLRATLCYCTLCSCPGGAPPPRGPLKCALARDV